MKTASRFLAGFALATALAGTASADDLPAVTAQIRSASAALSSFVIEMSIAGTTGVSSRITYVRPQRMKDVVTLGTMSVESYFIDGTVYIHTPMNGWQKISADSAHTAAQSMNIADALKSAKVRYLPDRRENGVTVGVFQVDSKLPSMTSTLPGIHPANAPTAAPQTTTCTFDKATHLLRTCSSSLVTMTYSNFNDPANVVELPPEAKNAVPLVISTPAMTPANAPPATGEPTPLPSPAAEAPSPALPVVSPTPAPEPSV